MTRTQRYRLLNKLITAFACTAIIAVNAWALPEDTQQELRISSDQATLDRVKGEVVYTGNVIVEQGTLKITADTVTLISKDKVVQRVIAKGSPAHYEQIISLNDEKTIAYGQTIIYHTTSEQLELLEKAGLTKAGNVFNGEKLVYYIKDQRVEAEGQSQKKSDGRIKMIIQPKTAAQSQPAAKQETVESSEPSPSSDQP